MALDLTETVGQLDVLARRLDDGKDDWRRRLEVAVDAMMGAGPGEVRQKVAASQGRPYLCATPLGGLGDRHPSGPMPRDFYVASVDGSHIDVDRHLPVRCYLINVGGCVLTYGSEPDAWLFSHPRLFAEEEELYITGRSDDSMEAVPVEGALLGLMRGVAEVEALAAVVDDTPPRSSVLALIDGSLVLWGLAGRGYRPYVRERILQRGLVPALDRLRKAAQDRSLAAAAYISLPQSSEVVHTLRLQLCSVEVDECRQGCSGHRAGRTPCDTVNGFLDRHLFQQILQPGERSSVFRTSSSVSTEFYGPHQVHFYYLNTGDEIARVEVPQWVAEDATALELGHALIMDQCRRGMGYPAAIAEAHEQAVISGSDREAFRQLMEDALFRRRLPVYTSEKARSKRTRWV